jgi:tetraacyldisaccharide 4'-kinase
MKWWQIILWPLSLLYGSLLAVRNGLYNIGLFKSVAFEVPTIVVGNLEVGGSGKSPFVDFLATQLENKYKIGILSRGYGRNTRGFLFVKDHSEADRVGDESLMLKLKHPNAIVAVCENRVIGMNEILKEYPHLDCILLDDAFQHRRLKAGYYILLTQFALPFYNDFVLPAGRLREFAIGRKRANTVVVTKMPIDISTEKQIEMKRLLDLNNQQSVFFAKYIQGDLIQVFGGEALPEKNVILITGIANASRLKIELSKEFVILKHAANSDHYKYEKASFDFFNKVADTKTIITTAKDWVKWQPFLSVFEGWKVFVAPIKVEVKEEEILINKLSAYIDLNKHGIRKS